MKFYVVFRQSDYCKSGIHIVAVEWDKTKAAKAHKTWASRTPARFDLAEVRTPLWTLFHYDPGWYAEKNWHKIDKVLLTEGAGA